MATAQDFIRAAVLNEFTPGRSFLSRLFGVALSSATVFLMFGSVL